MVKSKSNKMHLEIKNDLELDVNNASSSRRNRKSKKTSSSSSPIKRIKKVSNNLKTRKGKGMSSANAKMLKKRPSKRITAAKRISALKSKPRKPFILINGKRVPLKAAVKMSSASRKSASRRGASTSRREASSSKRNVSDSRRKASVSRRKVSDSRRRASDARRKASASRRKASTARRKVALARLRDARGRFTKKGNGKTLSFKAKSGRSKALKQAKLMSVAKEKAGKSSTVGSGPIEKVREFWSNLTSSSDSKDKETAAAAEAEDKRIKIKVRARKEPVTASKSEGSSNGNETQTIYMPIEQSSSSNGKTAEAIIIKKDDVDVKDVKILEKN